MKPNRTELSRLVAAAVVSRRFRKLLFTEPAKALKNGCNGETFCFTPVERQLIFAIVAKPPSGNAKTIEEVLQTAATQISNNVLIYNVYMTVCVRCYLAAPALQSCRQLKERGKVRGDTSE